jgi:hypothetical protein
LDFIWLFAWRAVCVEFISCSPLNN